MRERRSREQSFSALAQQSKRHASCFSCLRMKKLIGVGTAMCRIATLETSPLQLAELLGVRPEHSPIEPTAAAPAPGSRRRTVRMRVLNFKPLVRPGTERA